MSLMAALIATVYSQAASAQSSSLSVARPSELRVNPAVDLSVTLGGGALWLSAELLSTKLSSSSCRWCDRNSDGKDSLNGFDSSIRRHLHWSNTATAGALSDIFGFGLAPLMGTGVAALVTYHDNRLQEFPEDALLVAESAVIAGDLSELVKFSFARERPDVHARSPSERARLRSSSDNQSFYSGHASLAFSLATSAGTVASLRGYRLAPVMWVAGLTLASAASYLRIAADRHYATDVLAAGAVSAAIGFSVPYLHRASDLRVGALQVEGGRGLVVWGTW
jgi:membrane-associated phospholipid phosphatase